MTNKEAIGFLIKDKEQRGDCFISDALDTAIKALEQEPILDKIRAEVEQLRLHKAQFLTSDNKVCIDSREVLDIIDKYRKEQEYEVNRRRRVDNDYRY